MRPIILPARLRVLRPALLTACLALTLAVGALSTAQAEDITWDAGADGTWNTAANWNPQDVPDEAGEVALVPAGDGTYVITLNTSPALDAILFGNAEASLNLNGQTLTLLTATGIENVGTLLSASSGSSIVGAISNQTTGRIEIAPNASIYVDAPAVENSGVIRVHNSESSSNSVLEFLATTTLSGAGELLLHTSGGDNDATLQTAAGQTLTHEAAHHIRGAGTIQAALENYGTLTADQADGVLLLNTEPKTNYGTLQATGTAVMRIEGITLTQDGAGLMLADGTDIDIQSGAVVIGGTLDSQGAGRIECASGTATIADLTNDGDLDVHSNTTLVLSGSSITNHGTLHLHWDSSSYNAYLQVTDDLTLEGSGALLMSTPSGSPGDAVVETTESYTLTQDAGHTIQGAGQIKALMINEGEILATTADEELVLMTNAKTNRGVMGASGGLLEIVCEITQEAGGVLTADAGEVRYDTGAVVTGGTLTSAGEGAHMVFGGTATFQDLTNEGTLRIKPNTTCVLGGGQLANSGLVHVHGGTSSYTARLLLDGDLTLASSGTIHLDPDVSYLDAIVLGGTDELLTNTSDHTIRGAGQINAPIENHGTIQADHAELPLRVEGVALANQGLLGASSGGTLQLNGTQVTQSGAGVIVAEDAEVEPRNGSLIEGGELQASGTGTFTCSDGTATLSGVTLEAGYQIEGSATTVLGGQSVVNNGTIVVHSNASSTNAILRAAGELSLDGEGEVYLRAPTSENDAQLQTEAEAHLTLGAGQHLHGAGQINASLTNLGTILADGAEHRLDLIYRDKLNLGTLGATGDGHLRMNSITLTNEGLMTAADSGRIGLYQGILENRAYMEVNNYGLLNGQGATFRNAGQVLVTDNGEYLQTGGSLQNTGTITAGAGGYVELEDGTILNNGIVRAEGGGLVRCLELSQHYTGGTHTLSGGDWQVAAGSTMRLVGADVVHLDAGVLLSGTGSQLYSDEGTTDAIAGVTTIGRHGSLRIDAGRDFTTAAGLTSDGGIFVGEGSTLTLAGNIAQNWHTAYTEVNGELVGADSVHAVLGTVAGNGTIHADVICGDITSPGGILAGPSIGELLIDGDFEQVDEATLDIEIAGMGAGECDHLQVSGSAVLTGRIRAHAAEGAEISPGDVFTVLTAGGVSGQYDLLAGNLGVGLQYTVVYTDTTVEIHVYEDVSAVEDPTGGDPTGGDSSSDPGNDTPGDSGLEQALPQKTQLSTGASALGLTQLQLALPAPARVELEVFDFNGRRIARLASGELGTGLHRFRWDGRDNQGVQVPSGVYFARAVVEDGDGIRRLHSRLAVVR